MMGHPMIMPGWWQRGYLLATRELEPNCYPINAPDIELLIDGFIHGSVTARSVDINEHMERLLPVELVAKSTEGQHDTTTIYYSNPA